jgi:hypothetical protein
MDYQKIDLLAVFSDWKIGDWVYCLHCGCCYQVGEFRDFQGLQMCPYPDCSGDTVLDSYHWEDVKKFNNSYPEIPERSKIYLL